jgi:hypothetical protein
MGIIWPIIYKNNAFDLTINASKLMVTISCAQIVIFIYRGRSHQSLSHHLPRHAIAQTVADFSPRRDQSTCHVGYVLDKHTLGQSFAFILSLSFYRCSIFTRVSCERVDKRPVSDPVPQGQLLHHYINNATAVNMNVQAKYNIYIYFAVESSHMSYENHEHY